MMKILNWLTGPLTSLGEKYIEGRNNAEQRRLENEAARDVLQKELTGAMLDDDFKRAELAAVILRRDRGDYRTSWIRPVTAGLALLLWVALALSQIVWVGYDQSNALLPIIWHVPPGELGTLFTAFPLGVLATFYIARPFEKFLIGRTGV